MEILYTNCAGLDVHKKTVKVCLLTQASNGQSHKVFRTYFTTTEELLQLCDWLTEQGCTHIAFEATGVYWKPVFNLLEGSFEVLVVNAQHIKAVPGRKTDVKDVLCPARWHFRVPFGYRSDSVPQFRVDVFAQPVACLLYAGCLMEEPSQVCKP
jgi:transposase